MPCFPFAGFKPCLQPPTNPNATRPRETKERTMVAGGRKMGNVVEAGLARTRNNHLIDVKDEDWGRSPFASVIGKSFRCESEHGALCVLELSLSGSVTHTTTSIKHPIRSFPFNSVIIIRQFLLCERTHTQSESLSRIKTPQEEGKRKVRNKNQLSIDHSTAE